MQMTLEKIRNIQPQDPEFFANSLKSHTFQKGVPSDYFSVSFFPIGDDEFIDYIKALSEKYDKLSKECREVKLMN